MTAALSRHAIAQAYVAACRLEVRTLKPGNVHVFANGHRMTVADFDLSAEVSAPYISDPTLCVGHRILAAVEATFAAAGTNTNLGIVLLCAPLAAAAELSDLNANFESSLREILATLDHDDARAVYKAIAIANPAGLGQDETGDIRSEPPAHWTLLDAMRAAAGRDMIAEEYATGFATVLATARHYTADLQAGAAPEDALARLFLCLLAERADTHIIRKHGDELASRVKLRAAQILATINPRDSTAFSNPEIRATLLQFDFELKSWGANPGSLADLMCASVFAAKLANASNDMPDCAPAMRNSKK